MAEITVPASADGQRLDRFIKAMRKDLPFIAVQKLVRTGKIRVDGEKMKASTRVAMGQVVTVPEEGPVVSSRGIYQLTNADRQMLQEATVYEDEALLVINKPAGLPAQAGSGHTRSLDRIMQALYGDNAPKLVHRLDKDTTGLLVLAKNREAAAAMGALFAERAMEKMYLAVVIGEMPGTGGDIHAPLAKHSHAHGSRAVVDDDTGEAAHTSWQWVEAVGDGLHLVTATPHTGRMNQLRAHFAYIGCPIVGDDKYGGKLAKQAAAGLGAEGVPLFLHAWKLAFNHPFSGKPMKLTATLPLYFNTLTLKDDGARLLTEEK